ncbi:NAD-dependent epimerase/dehydratase family protein [Angustibacter peucedani]
MTGGSGFIGGAVVGAARDAGHQVQVLDLAAAPAADVRAASAVQAAVDDVDAVVHLAAKVGLEQGLDDLPDYVSHNVLGTSVLLAALARREVPRMVLASSMVLYGEGVGRCSEHGDVRPGPRRQGDLAAGRYEPPCPTCGRELAPALVGEDVGADPRSGYAVSKVAQEQLSAVWARQSGGSVAALRFHNVYGPGLPLDTPYAGVAAIFRSAVRAGRAPQVTEDGGQRRDFVHVRDVARACVAALSAPLPTGALRAFNVGSGTPRTVLDLATTMTDLAGTAAPEVTGAARLADVRHITASSERARAELGWAAIEDFVAGVRELLDEA